MDGTPQEGTPPGPKTVGNAAGVPWRVLDDARPLANKVHRPGYIADAEQVESYLRDGVALVPGAFTDWVEPLRAGLERNLAHPDEYAFPCDSTGPDEPGRFFDSYCNWQHIAEYRDFVFQSGAASMAATFMGSATAQLFHDHAFCKEDGTTKATPWHHDMPYYCVDGRQTASVYVALDRIPAETAVSFVKGSHRTDLLYRPRNFSAGAEYSTADASMVSAPDVDANPDAHELFVAALRPGDALIFDFRTLHGAAAVPVAGRRRAFSTRWLGDDITYVERPGETSPPLTDLGQAPGTRMREDWFPVLWPNAPS